jgi:hypothetical protein
LKSRNYSIIAELDTWTASGERSSARAGLLLIIEPTQTTAQLRSAGVSGK